MDARHLDTEAKIAELERLLAGADSTLLWDAAARAQLASEFRDTDEMIGLGAVDADRVAAMKDLARKARARAAELGHIDAGVDVANRIYFGRDTAQAALAFAYASRALEHGRALYLLGLFYYVGFGVPKDEVKSLDYHLRAAKAGEADAMFELYVFYSKGIATTRDDAAALAWCTKAAEAGSARAMANLGGFYATGNGVDKDPERALEWYSRAAEAGSGRAAATLGIMYALGDGVDADDNQAATWFAVADELGFPWEPLAEQCGLDPEEYV